MATALDIVQVILARAELRTTDPVYDGSMRIPKLIVVTAASSNHFGALKQMLESLRRLGARVEIYDIGLTADEARALPRWPGFFYHPFDYAAYPPYLNAAVNAGEYAW